MKKTTFKLMMVALGVLLSIDAMAQDHVSCVYLTLKGGGVIAFAVNEHPKIEYHGPKAEFSSEKLTVEYDVSDVEKITFGHQLADGIKSQKVDSEAIISHEGCVSFIGFEAGSMVMVYSLSGTLVDSKRIPKNGGLSIDTSAYPSGVYIFKNNRLTYKLMKK